MFHLLLPAMKLGKVMFLHVSVILFTGGGGLPHCMLGYTPHPPPGPKAGTPPPEYTPPSRHPPQDQAPPPSAVHAGRYGQQAGGTHPTGMQSCSFHLINSRMANQKKRKPARNKVVSISHGYSNLTTMITVSIPATIIIAWKASVQTTAFIPPWNFEITKYVFPAPGAIVCQSGLLDREWKT